MTAALVEALTGAIGPAGVLHGEAIDERYRTDILRKSRSDPGVVVRPQSTEEVAAVVRIAAAARVPITALGGATGLVGGGIAAAGGIVLSFERMSRIVEIDTVSMTITVESGAVIETVQKATEAEGLLFPLDLGARGSATVGGTIATNAGGVRVLRWGMMRDMVLGLEAVLADGTVVSSMTGMIKDNAGYNWKHLLIGSEGTLAVVTRAVLRLRPLPTTRQTALIAMASFEAAIRAMRQLETSLSGQLSSFELMWEDFYALHTEAQLAQRPRPMPLGHPIYALVEAMGGDEEGDAALFQRALMALSEQGLVADAVIAQSDRHRVALWAMRDDLTPGYQPLRPFAAYDVSMAIADMPAFVEQARAAVMAIYPDVTMLFYGHAGDGNLHALLSIKRIDKDIQRAFDDAIYGVVRRFGGSIAAEHGVGTTRRDYLGWSRSESEVALMRSLKHALDPKGILNPGKIFLAI